MKKIANILNGWGKRLGILQISSAESKLATLRTKVCLSCPFSKESRLLRFLNGNADYEKVIACEKCGCPINEKTIVVDESCPIGKW